MKNVHPIYNIKVCSIIVHYFENRFLMSPWLVPWIDLHV